MGGAELGLLCAFVLDSLLVSDRRGMRSLNARGGVEAGRGGRFASTAASVSSCPSVSSRGSACDHRFFDIVFFL